MAPFFPFVLEALMNSTPPTDETAITDEIAPVSDSETTTPAQPAKPATGKQRFQPGHYNPRGFYKGGKIGNGPRGSRRSMGKR